MIPSNPLAVAVMEPVPRVEVVAGGNVPVSSVSKTVRLQVQKLRTEGREEEGRRET